MRTGRELAQLENDSSKTGTLFLRSISFGFLELSFFLEKQFFDHAAFYGIGDDFEHFPIVLNVLPPGKVFHARLSRSRPQRWLLS
jgi:hypothetical protein